MPEVYQYCESWTKLGAEGGVIQGFFLPANCRRRRNVNGDDAFQFAIPKGHRLAALIEKGQAIREILSLDGATWREWVVNTYTRGSGDDPLMVIECIPPLHVLLNYPVSYADIDGFVYQRTAAIQLTPANIITNYIRANTPSWIVNGTITPTALVEVPFSDDSALSGLRRM